MNAGRQRIIVLNPWDRLIGPNRYMLEMFRQDAELSASATIVFHQENDAAAEYQALGCQVVVWPEISLVHPRLTSRNIAHLLQNHTVGLDRVIRRLRVFHPSVIVSNTENLWIGGLAAYFLRIPHMQVVHSLTIEYRWHSLRRIALLYLWCLSRLSTRFIAVSAAVKRMLVGHGIQESKIETIPNGFDVQKIQEKSQGSLPDDIHRLIQRRYPILVSIGRIAPMKGQHILIEAISKLQNDYPTLLCLFVGASGSNESVEDIDTFRSELIWQIERYRLQTSVHFLGEIDYVPELLNHTDVYVHPSFTESFSRAVVEALICNRPVICTDAGALPEVVGKHGALLVPVGDAEAVARGIRLILDDEALRRCITAFGHTYVEKTYPIALCTEKLLNILTHTVENRDRAHNG